MADICGDNRFELIEKYKQKLLDATNIEDSPEEMAVIDNILFRFWQMGWLKGELFGISEQLDCSDCVNHGGDWDCDHVHCRKGTDTISRQWLMECVEEGWIKFDTQEDENRFVHLIRDIAPSAQPVAKDINVPVKDCISRASAIETYRKAKDKSEAHRMLVQLPSAQSELVRKIYAIGYTGKEGRIYIGGRLFAVRELAQ